MTHVIIAFIFLFLAMLNVFTNIEIHRKNRTVDSLILLGALLIVQLSLEVFI